MYLDEKDNHCRGTMKVAIDCQSMCALAWMDKRPVALLSTEYGPTWNTTARRILGQRPLIQLPEIAKAYNDNKDAVDHGNKACLSRLGGSLEQEAHGHK